MADKKPPTKQLTTLDKINQKMRNPRGNQTDEGLDFSIPEFVENFPTVNAYLCEDTGKAGVRKGATITLWVDSQGLHMVVNDRDHNLKAFFVSHGLSNLWADLEGFLLSDDPDWRNASSGTKQRPRKPK